MRKMPHATGAGLLAVLVAGWLSTAGCRRVEYLVDGGVDDDAAESDTSEQDSDAVAESDTSEQDSDAVAGVDVLLTPDLRPLLPCHPAVSPNCSAGMCQIPAGCFMMGSPASEPCRAEHEQYHQVTLTHGFSISQSEVTQQAWQALMGQPPPRLGFPACGATCPVEGVSWLEAVAYANARSKAEGLAECYTCTTAAPATCEVAVAYRTGSLTIYDCPGYRLPTEAEWEYAYRAGTSSAYPSGPLLGSCAGDPNADAIGWNDANSGGSVHTVGQKPANGWGLHDMGGNVWEWVSDYYTATPGVQAVIDPVGPKSAPTVALKGGCWDSNAATMRAAMRRALPKGSQDSRWTGFRIARTVAQ